MNNLNRFLVVALSSIATQNICAAEVETTHSFNIVKKPLAEALNEWSKITGANFFAKPQDLTDLKSTPLMGNFKSTEALQILLANTGLSFRKLNSGSYIVEPHPEQTTSLSTDEIIVTGYQASMYKSLQIKKEQAGVVDAISALDINRFPDSNLAEALQRIAGVSIDRAGNEGNKITVRGMGPDFNLVTRNGRRTPVTTIPAVYSLNEVAPASRSYEFINLATEGIDSVLVNKTANASIASGGIGASVDIRTPRPFVIGADFIDAGINSLDSNLLQISSFDENFEQNKEAYISAAKIVSEQIGFYLNASIQNKNSSAEGATIAGWVDESTAISQWFQNNLYDISNTILENSNQFTDGYTWMPLNQSIETGTISRDRINLQFTLQGNFAERWQLVFDSSLQNVTITPELEQFSTQFFGSDRDDLFGENLSTIFDTNGTATQIIKNKGIYNYLQESERISKKSTSNAINFHYDLADNAGLTLDISHAQADAGSKTENLKSLALGANTVTFNNNGSVPSLDFLIDNPFIPENLTTITEPRPLSTFNQKTQHQITDIKLKGDWKFFRGSILDLGIESLNSTYKTEAYEAIFQTTWQLDFDFFPQNNTLDDFFDRRKVSNILSDLGSPLADQNTVYVSDFSRLDSSTNKITTSSDDFDCYCEDPVDSHKITERIFAAYAKLNIQWSNFFPGSLEAGLRGEKTDVSVTSLVDTPEAIEWANPNFTYIRFNENRTQQSEESDYFNLLPSINTQLYTSKNTILRAGLSRSLARTDPTQLRNDFNLYANLTGAREAYFGNPNLRPYTSDNLDISFEWYYQSGNYFSAAWFKKYLDNFVTTSFSTNTLFDLRDVYNGERANLARQELIDAGVSPSNFNVLQRIIANGGGTGTQNSQGDEIVKSNATDPLIEWNIRQPINQNTAILTGYELSWQHSFGQSGWGTFINYTAVSSSTNYQLRQLGYQFDIPGVSDTFNAIVYFESDRFDIRLAYNWRDQFLSGLTTLTGDQPQFTEAYDQWDLSAEYRFSQVLSGNFTAINLLGEDQRIHARYSNQLIAASQFEPLYIIGLKMELD